MLTSISVQNFKSFGEEQTIPLQPITVLVGPNNSGKSNLVSLARFVRTAATAGADSAFAMEGGVGFVIRRPATGDGSLCIRWTTDAASNDEGSYLVEMERGASQLGVVQRKEHLRCPLKADDAWIAVQGNPSDSQLRSSTGSLVHGFWDNREPMAGLKIAVSNPKHTERFRSIWSPLVSSREIKLLIPALSKDAAVVVNPRLEGDGSNMAAVLGLWRGSDLDRAEKLDAFMRSCLPEIARVLVKPGPVPGQQRLWVQQTDGEQFDAPHISDGVLSFLALAMHAIDAEPGSLLLIEEPEQSIHPRRIHDLVELFRTIVHERKCQIIVVTHSPVLLHELRDDPAAILLFRRDETKGTRVNSLTDFPDLLEAMSTKHADPGDMLVDGFFNSPS